MKIRILVLGIFLASACMVFGAGQGDGSTASSEEAKEIEWIMFATSMNYEDPDLYLWQMVKEVSNLIVSPIPLSRDVAADKINVLIASKNIPDIISMEFDRLNLVAPKGPFVNIGQNLDKIPHLKKFVDQYGEAALDAVTADDGELYNMPAVNTWEEGMMRSGRHIMLRGDLLTNMKPEDIETVADVEKAFINITKNFGKPILSMRDMAFGGTQFDTMPIYMGTSVQQVPYYNPATRKFENQFETKKQRTYEAIELMARWYELGIIHPEFASQPDKIWEGMLMGGELAAQFEHAGRPVLDTQAVQLIDPSFYFSILARPSYKGEHAPLMARFRPFTNGQNSFISAQTDALDEIFALFDDMYNEDNFPKWSMGDREGLDYVIRDDGTYRKPFTRQQSDENLYWEDYKMGIVDYGTKVRGIGYGEFFRVRSEHHNMEYRFYSKEDLKVVLDFVDEMEALNLDIYYPPTPKYGAQADLAADIRNNVKTYILESYIKFINGTKDLSEYDTFVEDLEKFKYDDLVDMANAATGL